MFKLTSTLFLVFISTLTIAATSSDRDDFLSAGSGSAWGDSYVDEPNSNTSTSSAPTVSSQSQADVVCTKDKQNSIPYKSFLNLLAGKKLTIRRDAESGTLTLDGGMMIANCNNMLDFKFYQPEDGRPYLFQVAVKRPDGCGGDKCSYDVHLAEDNVATGETKKIEVEPTYYGFIQCLRETGVLDGKNFVASKIAPVEFREVKDNVKQRSELLFYSHGPEAAIQKGVYSGNKIKENSCRFYEDIADGGYTIYSKSDVERNRKEVLFNDICNNGDYLEISRRLPEFAEFDSMYRELKKVRDIKILAEVKKLHDEISGSKDLSGVDVDNYKKVIGDFYSEIIDPKRKKIERLVTSLARTSSKSEKDIIREDLKTLVKDLLKYNKSPYITIADYGKMRSFVPKSPLHEDAWREAALMIYKSNNIAHHYSRFDKDTRVARDLEPASIAEVREFVKADFSEQEEKMKQLGRLATDHDSSYVSDYTQKAETLKYEQQLFNQESQYMIQEQLSQIQQKCMNPRFYWVVNNPLMQRNCIQKAQMGAQAIQEDTMYFNQDVQGALQGYQTQINSWQTIEQQRNLAYGVKPSNRANTQFDPRALRDPRFSELLNRYNPMVQYHGLQQGQGQIPGRMYTQPFGQATPFNPINAGAGVNGNYNFQYGLNNNQGMNSRNPAGPAVSWMVPPAMINHQNSMQYNMYR